MLTWTLARGGPGPSVDSARFLFLPNNIPRSSSTFNSGIEHGATCLLAVTQTILRKCAKSFVCQNAILRLGPLQQASTSLISFRLVSLPSELDQKLARVTHCYHLTRLSLVSSIRMSR